METGSTNSDGEAGNTPEMQRFLDRINSDAAEPPPSPGAAPEGDADDARMTAFLAQMLLPMFAVMRPSWAITGDECVLLAESWVPVINKYFPDFEFGVEFNAVAATMMVFGPRLLAPAPAIDEPLEPDDTTNTDTP